MLLRRVEGYGIQKSWTSFDQISANLVRAVIASEDSRFCNHHGFDWNAIETAGIATGVDAAVCWALAPSPCKPQECLPMARARLGA